MQGDEKRLPANNRSWPAADLDCKSAYRQHSEAKQTASPVLNLA